MCSVIVVEYISQTSHLKHHEGKVGHQIISPAQTELLSKVASPVTAFQLHRVGKHGTNIVFQRTDTTFDSLGHVIQIFADRLFVHVVEDRTGSSWSTVDHAGKRFDPYQGIKDKFAFRNIDRNYLIADLIRKIDRLVDPAHRVGNQF